MYLIHRLVRYLHRLNGVHYIDRRLSLIRSEISELSDQLKNHLDWPRYLDLDAPLYLLKSGKLSLRKHQGVSPKKVIVISIPKSGTYLVSSILRELGLVDTGVHVWETGFHDYRDRTISEMIYNYAAYAVNLPIADTVDLILPGQYAVGHLACIVKNKDILKSFRKIFLIRELRQSLISHMRWFSQKGRGLEHDQSWKEIRDRKSKMKVFMEIFADDLIEWYSSIADWSDEEDILVVKFENLMGDRGFDNQLEQIMNISKKVGINIDVNTAKEVLQSVLNKPTKTWSGRRSSIEEYWSERCEVILLKNGGDIINSKLGYIKNKIYRITNEQSNSSGNCRI